MKSYQLSYQLRHLIEQDNLSLDVCIILIPKLGVFLTKAISNSSQYNKTKRSTHQKLIRQKLSKPGLRAGETAHQLRELVSILRTQL